MTAISALTLNVDVALWLAGDVLVQTQERANGWAEGFRADDATHELRATTDSDASRPAHLVLTR